MSETTESDRLRGELLSTMRDAINAYAEPRCLAEIDRLTAEVGRYRDVVERLVAWADADGNDGDDAVPKLCDDARALLATPSPAGGETTEEDLMAAMNEAKIADVRRTLRDAEIYDEWGAEYTRNGPAHLTAATYAAIERHLERRMRVMETNMQNGARDRASELSPNGPHGHRFERDEAPQPGRMRCTECGQWQYPATPHPACASRSVMRDAEAFRRGAETMREAAAKLADERTRGSIIGVGDMIIALPLPEGGG